MFCLYCTGAHILQNSWSHLKILGARRVTRRKLLAVGHTNITRHRTNLDPWAIWGPEFVPFWCTVYTHMHKPIWRTVPKKKQCLHKRKLVVVCLFSWRYNPLWLYFHSQVAGFSLLVFRGFLITHNDAPQSVGLLWTSDQSVAETAEPPHFGSLQTRTQVSKWNEKCFINPAH
jgi:hypothetical protein